MHGFGVGHAQRRRARVARVAAVSRSGATPCRMAKTPPEGGASGGDDQRDEGEGDGLHRARLADPGGGGGGEASAGFLVRWFSRSRYKQKQARNRRQSTQHHATRCAKTSLWLNFSESLSNSAAVKTKNQLNRSEGTKVMVV